MNLDELSHEVTFKEGVTFLADNKTLQVSEVRAVHKYEVDGYSHVQVVLNFEGVIIDAFNEEEECYKTMAFTYDEFAEMEPGDDDD